MWLGDLWPLVAASWDVPCARARSMHLSGNGVCLLSHQFLLLEGASGGRVAGMVRSCSCVCSWLSQGWSQLRRRFPIQRQCCRVLYTVQEPLHLLVSNGRSNTIGCFMCVFYEVPPRGGVLVSDDVAAYCTCTYRTEGVEYIPVQLFCFFFLSGGLHMMVL